jgi:hypothetical protein
MLLFGVTIPATVPQGSEIPEGLMNNPLYASGADFEFKNKVCVFDFIKISPKNLDHAV